MRRLIADQTHAISLKLNGKPVHAEAEPRMLLSDRYATFWRQGHPCWL